MDAYIPYLLIAAGTIFMCYLLIVRSEKTAIKKNGIAVRGVVFELENSSTRIGDELISKQNITVRFQTLEKEWITEKYKPSERYFSSFQYHSGQKIEIIYDKDDPTNFLIVNHAEKYISFIPFALCAAMIAYGGYLLYNIHFHT